jgi:hypothetical protein
MEKYSIVNNPGVDARIYARGRHFIDEESKNSQWSKDTARPGNPL